MAMSPAEAIQTQILVSELINVGQTLTLSRVPKP